MTIYVCVAVLRAARNALAGRSLPTPALKHRGLKHYILYWLENDNYKAA